MTITRLYFIRHGQSWGNADEIMVGMRTDAGLTDLGRLQAERLRDRLAATGEITADVLIASTLPRAFETAEIIAPALGLAPLGDDELHECRAGEGEGLSYAEFTQRYGGCIGRSATEPADLGGESWAAFCGRVSDAIERIAREYAGKSIVVVCHGGVIASWLVEMLAPSRTALPLARIDADNTSITEWARDDDAARPLWYLRRFNDDTHVMDIGSAQRMDWRAASARRDQPRDDVSAPLPTDLDTPAPVPG